MTYMEVVMAGFLVSIGWGIGKIIINIISEIIFERLHSSDRYRIICKKETKSNRKKKDPSPYMGTSIGFYKDTLE